jgi:hypothetical protein
LVPPKREEFLQDALRRRQAIDSNYRERMIPRVRAHTISICKWAIPLLEADLKARIAQEAADAKDLGFPPNFPPSPMTLGIAIMIARLRGRQAACEGNPKDYDPAFSKVTLGWANVPEPKPEPAAAAPAVTKKKTV